MSRSEIHIKIDDPIWMDAFKERIVGFCIEKQGHEIRIPLHKVIQILKAETDRVWGEYIFESIKADWGTKTPTEIEKPNNLYEFNKIVKKPSKKKAICRDHC
jgi:hypothetical protein